MEIDFKIRKVTQDVLLFVWFKHNVIVNEPSLKLCFLPEIPADLISNLSISVCFEFHNNVILWENFFNKHFERMTSSMNLFTKYIAYVFDILNKPEDAFKCFFDTLSFMTYLSVYCWKRERNQFINVCAELFNAFFQQEIQTKFENQGGWEHFNGYLVKHKDLETCKSLLSDKKSFQDKKDLQVKPRQREEPFKQINGVFIDLVSSRQVETDKNAESFEKSVEDTVSELYKKEFCEILNDFARLDSEVKATYRETVEEASESMAREVENFPLPKLQKIENILTACEPEKEVQQSQTFAVLDDVEIKSLDKINSQDIYASDKPLPNPRSRQLETAKNILAEIVMDIAKLTDIIQCLSTKHGVQASEPIGK